MYEFWFNYVIITIPLCHSFQFKTSVICVYNKNYSWLRQYFSSFLHFGRVTPYISQFIPLFFMILITSFIQTLKHHYHHHSLSRFITSTIKWCDLEVADFFQVCNHKPSTMNGNSEQNVK